MTEPPMTRREFIRLHTRTGAQDTSFKAADKARAWSEYVMGLIMAEFEKGPRIDEKLEIALYPITDSTVCARRKDLVYAGKVTEVRKPDGTIVTEENLNESPCVVWRAVLPGEDIVPPPRPAPKPKTKTRASVAAAIRVKAWMTANRNQMICIPPDWSDIQALLDTQLTTQED